MPELPDVTVYVESLERLVKGATLEHIRLASPFVLRSVDPPPSELEGKRVVGIERLGKRIVIELEAELFAVINLMIAGRFQWHPRGKAVPGKIGLAAFDFTTGTLVLTEASTKKRASLHLARGREALKQHDRGGLEPLDST